MNDAIDLEKLKISEFVGATMNPARSKKMETVYKRKMGAAPNQLQELANTALEQEVKDEEAMQKYLDTKSLEKFLDSFEQKTHGMRFLNKLLMKYLRQEPVLGPSLRVKFWRIITKSDKQAANNPGYYQSLVDSLEEPFKNFAQVIDLDVKRTLAAQKSKSVYQQLTNILLAYAKRNSRVGYCQGLNGIVAYFLQKKMSEEVRLL